ncbi:MAG: hypothetical protein IJG50_00010 [Clostridia bacterium]|nr:hypothetical protein [Clostridia bacterium]
MNLQKRNCDINMRLVPYGAGWTDVYLTIAGDKHYFIISDVLGDQFDDFLSILYHLYPGNIGDETGSNDIECKVACDEYIDGEYKTVKIVDSLNECQAFSVFHDVPWKAHFTWDEEGNESVWELERDPTEDLDFELRISIEHNEKHFQYSVRYADFCYAVAKACTEALKKHGFTGYHKATYTQDFNVRHLLFLKGVALSNLDACKLTYYEEKGDGETSDFEKELELLLFDM